AGDFEVDPLRTGEGGAGADGDEGIGVQGVVPPAGRLPAGEVDIEGVGRGGGAQGQAAGEGGDREQFLVHVSKPPSGNGFTQSPPGGRFIPLYGGSAAI